MVYTPSNLKWPLGTFVLKFLLQGSTLQIQVPTLLPHPASFFSTSLPLSLPQIQVSVLMCDTLAILFCFAGTF